MRKLLILVPALLFAGSVHAATLSYVGSLQFQLATLPGITASGGGIATITTTGNHLSTMALAAGAFGPVSASLPVTNSGTINSVIFTSLANASGTVNVSGGLTGTAGPLGLSGTAKICLVFAPCALANVTVPLAGGFGTGGTQIVSGAVAVTMQHNPWVFHTPTMTIHSPNSNVTLPHLTTTQTQKIPHTYTGQTTTPGGYTHMGATTWVPVVNTGQTTTTFTTVDNVNARQIPSGFAHGPDTATSTTAQPSGVVQLVSVSKTYTSLTTAFPELPLVALINIHFVPEPGTLLLLGSGVVGLAVLGRKRRR